MLRKSRTSTPVLPPTTSSPSSFRLADFEMVMLLKVALPSEAMVTDLL